MTRSSSTLRRFVVMEIRVLPNLYILQEPLLEEYSVAAHVSLAASLQTQMFLIEGYLTFATRARRFTKCLRVPLRSSLEIPLSRAGSKWKSKDIGWDNNGTLRAQLEMISIRSIASTLHNLKSDNSLDQCPEYPPGLPTPNLTGRAGDDYETAQSYTFKTG